MNIWTLITLLLVLPTLSCAVSNPMKADKILVFKRDKYMLLLKDGKVLRRYNVTLGRNLSGHKQMEGDYRTPEGVYTISEKKPQSRFYKSLRISYPNCEDIERAAELGVDPGGDIMIHGIEKRYAKRGNPYIWTRGCIALPNPQMEEVWTLVDAGTPIEIRS